MSKAQIVVTAKDRASKTLSKIKGSLTSINPVSLGVVASFGALALATKKVVSAYNVQEQAETKLKTALKATGDFTRENFKALKDMASAQQLVTTFGDEATIASVAQLKAYSNLSTQMIVKLTPAIQDFASAQGIDLKTAMELVGKSIGSQTNALSRYGIELDTSATKAEKAEQLMAGLNSKFGGQAQAQAQTFSGKITQMSNAFGDLLENIGSYIAKSPRLTGLIDATISVLNRLTEAISNDLSPAEMQLLDLQKQLTEQQKNLNVSSKENTTAVEEQATGNYVLAGSSEELSKQLDETNEKLIKSSTGFETVTSDAHAYINTTTDTIGKLEQQIEAIKSSIKAEKALESKKILNATAERERNEKILEQDELKRQLAELDKQISAEKAELKKQELDQAIALAEKEVELSNKSRKAIVDNLEAEAQARERNLNTSLNALQFLGSEIKELAIVGKAAAIVQATRDTYVGATKAYAQGGILGFVTAGLITAAGLANVAKIASTPAFQTPQGATRVIPGNAGTPVPIIAHGGETIGRGGGSGLTINFTGTSFNSDETAGAIMELIRDRQLITGEQLI